jgi:peptide/nickel transport system ATP-binding protein
MTAAALTVERLTVSYPLAVGRFNAVDGVSFSVRPGETFGLVGESGSGKTTTAMAILRLLRPPARIDGGSVRLNGTDLLTASEHALRRIRWQQLSLVPQGAMNSLNPVMRIGQQLGDVIVTHEGRRAARSMRARLEKLLATVGLPSRVTGMYPHELSGGMKQRVCIAMAVALEPRLIIADEPTSALDVVVQRVVAQTLLEVQDRLSAGLILIGHDMGLQAQMVDRLAVMYRGRLVEQGPVREMFRAPVHPYTRLLIASVPSIKKVKATVADRDALAKVARGASGCALGADCGRRSATNEEGVPFMHDIGPDHLVTCGVVELAEEAVG